MFLLATGLIAVPVLERCVKRWLLHHWRGRSVSLGPLGSVRMVQSKIWLARACGRPVTLALGGLWIWSAIALVLWCAHVPACSVFAGLLLGGSLSHGLESARSGQVIDYICLRFWPAFDLSDAAITIGALGLIITGTQALTRLVA
jgi:lipoprotein signal peptidase